MCSDEHQAPAASRGLEHCRGPLLYTKFLGAGGAATELRGQGKVMLEGFAGLGVGDLGIAEHQVHAASRTTKSGVV